MADCQIRVSDLPEKTDCIEPNAKVYVIEPNESGGFDSVNVDFDHFSKSVHKQNLCYGYSFKPCRIALNHIHQDFGENNFTSTYGTAPSGTVATDLFNYWRTNIHINNRLSVTKYTCLCCIICDDCDDAPSVAYAQIGLYVTSKGQVSGGVDTEEEVSIWISDGQNNNQALINYEGILEHQNGTNVLDENSKLDLYGIDNSVGLLGSSIIRSNTFDAGTEGTCTYYSMIVEVDPENPQITIDFMLTQQYDNGSEFVKGNHSNPASLEIDAMVYLEGVYG